MKVETGPEDLLLPSGPVPGWTEREVSTVNPPGPHSHQALGVVILWALTPGRAVHAGEQATCVFGIQSPLC